MNKPYAKELYKNFLQPSEQYDVDAIECEFDCEIKFNTYVYQGDNVFVSEIDLHQNLIVINSCDESLLVGASDYKELSVEEFITSCLN